MLALGEDADDHISTPEQVSKAMLTHANFPRRAKMENRGRNDVEDPYYVGLVRVWPGRAFYITKQGRPGVGVEGIQTSDKICVFFGGEPCDVLRGTADGKHCQ
jgi:hypothetical protein